MTIGGELTQSNETARLSAQLKDFRDASDRVRNLRRMGVGTIVYSRMVEKQSWAIGEGFRGSQTILDSVDALQSFRLARNRLTLDQKQETECAVARSVYDNISFVNATLAAMSDPSAVQKVVREVIANATYSNEYQWNRFFNFGQRHIDTLGSFSSEEEKLHGIADIIASDFVDEKTKAFDYEALYQLARDRFDSYTKRDKEFGEYLLAAGVSLDQKPTETTDEFYKRKLGGLGLPATQLIDSWRMSTSTWDLDPDTFRYSVDGAVNLNFVAMMALEARKPGVCKILVDEFNIHTVARYPQEILLDMVARKDDIRTPYVTAVFTRSDWNASFYEEEKSLESLHQQLSHLSIKNGTGFALRIVEADGKQEMLSVFEHLKGKYEVAGGQKMSALFLFGHGDVDSLQLGGDEMGGARSRDDYLEGEDFADITPYGIDNLPIVLVSCSNGIEGGMGEDASRRTQAVVRGSGVAGALERVVVKYFESSKRLWFDLKYKELPSGRIHPHKLHLG